MLINEMKIVWKKRYCIVRIMGRGRVLFPKEGKQKKNPSRLREVVSCKNTIELGCETPSTHFCSPHVFFLLALLGDNLPTRNCDGEFPNNPKRTICVKALQSLAYLKTLIFDVRDMICLKLAKICILAHITKW